jgi:hypothetical protein
MARFPEKSVLSFQASRDIGRLEVRQLALTAGKLGLEPLFDPGSDMLSFDEILYNRAHATYPTAPQNYIGKEHFRIIGDEVEPLIPHRQTSMFFTHLCYPFLVGRLIDPAEANLRVTSRQAVNMPPLEIVNMNNAYPSKRKRVHEAHFKDLPSEQDTVIQVREIIEIAKSQDRSRSLGILSTYASFAAFGERLEEITTTASPDD